MSSLRWRKTWVFDLDNTLHDARIHVFPHLHRAMGEYMQTHLHIDADAASALRRHYWKTYGATLLGMMRHHQTDPKHFLSTTHQFPDLSRMVMREPALRNMLRKLPGRKVVFSNAPIHYSSAVLRILRISDLFDDIFSVEHTRYCPKPSCYGFYRLFKKNRLRATQCVMVEDTLDNLKAAKKLGMKTVWVSASIKTPAYVDVKIRSVFELAAAYKNL